METLKNQFEKEVIARLDKPSSQPPSPNQDRRSGGSNLQGYPLPRAQPPRAGPPDWEQDLSQPRRFPPQVGGADLDPFHRGLGGGMLMDPRELYGNSGRFGPPPGRGPMGPSGHLPPGSIPPGARFDPFGPPPPGPRPGPRGPWPRGPHAGNPDPDHERPPDYDDMFM